ncbi:fumarylacetoacetate hydrolase [Lactiplantibacillus pentosus]|jgi:2-keto-4-pentenoate hydratase/2-oxohepta-3-ene-1,7-dioic acid hydratase in catechol pathway|uniref:Fumarylacetoacetate hydrolase family protein n=3 Tax=Lactiplantibacillus pentosus TaxID=1589 RepID=A0AB37RDR5_LACPE|nr:fumarylacetoacetate hydrolase family protein [Lactiplantibacillus pentosus]CCC16277.1 fumarylacetoacetate hydrolase [Lactiplantibacillus pentosus IG1]MCT3302232.1 fumarylacetoacetate hydrolase family protein [Lactiplantibacillus pentosus]PRO76867.1 fumarylacetoacetate hydrolase [Lactiplantibacillus pentosus]PRO78775.1 fumarylacetoacetate hydrolase [Lactiplantibacillus pentosus]
MKRIKLINEVIEMKIGMRANRPFIITAENQGQPILNAQTILEALYMAPDKRQLGPVETFKPEDLAAPVTQPQQIFAVGMNYRDHSEEIHITLPKVPSIFTKFSSSLAPANVTVTAHGPKTDWETELVVMIGRGGREISVADAMSHVAGVMVGEDLSDRDVQFENDNPQFSMGKSFENYAPVGPWLTTVDELANLDDEVITTTVNGQTMQQAPLRQLIFKVPDLVHYLSTVCDLQPGDLIFTGTPSGTGVGRDPQVFLKSGDQLTGHITHLGTLNITIK